MINIVDIVRSIVARKEAARRVPCHAMLGEIRNEIRGLDEGSVISMLDSEVDNGNLCRVRTIYGWAYRLR